MIALPIPYAIEAVYQGIPSTVGERRRAVCGLTMQTSEAVCFCETEKRMKMGEQSCRSRTDFLLCLSSLRAWSIVVNSVDFVTFCLQKYATFYVSVARMAQVSDECPPRAILQQANGDYMTFRLPSWLSRVRAPSPALTSSIIPSRSSSQADFQAYTMNKCINNVDEMRIFDL
jgi:hypothetical protein